MTDANGEPFEGVTVDAEGSGESAVTDALGRYQIDVPMGWSGGLTPSLDGVTFNPPTRGVVSVGLDGDGMNFAGGSPVSAIYVDNPARLLTISPPSN